MNKFFSHYNDTPKHVIGLSRKNRLNPTVSEEKLWSILSAKKLQGFKFRRQFPIGRYIVDFYNHANRLIIEADGIIHNETKEYDKNRESDLTAQGYCVLRFSNYEIETNLEKVRQQILMHLKVPLRGI